MRRIEPKKSFIKDLTRERRGKNKKVLDTELEILVDLLAMDDTLPRKYQDHALTGNHKGKRDCHVRPDLVLIYSKPDKKTLILIRHGSHAALSL